MSTIGITGGTGFIGTRLTDYLTGKGHQVVIFSRHPGREPKRPNVQYTYWNPQQNKCDLSALGKIDAMVHLAGASIAGRRWTHKRRQELISSRVDATRFLLSQLRNEAPNCKVLVSASATGFYGPDRPEADLPFREDAPFFPDFLGKICHSWEAAALQASEVMRTVVLRFGIVLGPESGAFHELSKPMKMGVMPILGSGRQVVSWIEVQDLCRVIEHAIEAPAMEGIYNAVAPEPCTHRRLMQTIAARRRGLCIPLPVPGSLLKLMLGKMSEEVLKSCTVSSGKLEETGFAFDHPTIGHAVAAIVPERHKHNQPDKHRQASAARPGR